MMMDAFVGIVGLLLIAYLFYAMFKPEQF